MIDTPDPDPEIVRVRKAVDELAEHYDTVQIFVTRYDGDRDGTTIRRHYGTGNWFARYGQTRIWVMNEEESERESIRTGEDEDD